MIALEGETIRIADQTNPTAAMTAGRGTTYHPAKFTHVAGTTQLAVGRIVSRETGKPIEGCTLRAIKLGNSKREGVIAAGFVRTTTDADGNYQLAGLPLGINRFSIIPPDGSDYIQVQNQVKTTASSEPFELNISLVTGVRIKGRVTDVRTGKPVIGTIATFAYRGHPLLKGKQRIRMSALDRPYVETDKQGKFEAVAIPGRGVLTFRADAFDTLRRGVGADTLTGPAVDFGIQAFDTLPHYVFCDNYHAFFEFNVPAGAIANADMQVDSGSKVTLQVVDTPEHPSVDSSCAVRMSVSPGESFPAIRLTSWVSILRNLVTSLSVANQQEKQAASCWTATRPRPYRHSGCRRKENSVGESLAWTAGRSRDSDSDPVPITCRLAARNPTHARSEFFPGPPPLGRTLTPMIGANW